MMKPNKGETFLQFLARINSTEEIRKSCVTPNERVALATTYWEQHRADVKKSYSVYTDEVASELARVAVPEVTAEEINLLLDVGMGSEVVVAKAQGDKQFVFGWASVAITNSGEYPIDWEGDMISPEDLENAAYIHVLAFGQSGELHKGESTGILIESMMFTKEKMAALGIPPGCVHEGWWVGYYIPDPEVFAKIKNGEYKMFSVQGKALRSRIRKEA